MIQVAKTLEELGPAKRAAVLTIGNFDGVHRAHRRLLEKLVRRAAELNAVSTVLTFDPHPSKVLAPEKAPKLISPLKEKIRLMEELGLQRLVVLPFTRELAKVSASAFVQDVVVKQLRSREVYVGPNFHFGHRQEGDTKLLVEWAGWLGFRVKTIPMLEIRGHTVSSTCIRSLISSGQVNLAGRLLGRPFSLQGPVVSGHGVGKKQTVPTLNLCPRAPEELLPREGVYVTQAWLKTAGPNEDFTQFPSVTNVGNKPTFGEHPITVEIYLLDFPRDTSFPEIKVEFLYRLRDERRFQDAAELKKKIYDDIRRSRRFFHLKDVFEQGTPNRLNPSPQQHSGPLSTF